VFIANIKRINNVYKTSFIQVIIKMGRKWTSTRIRAIKDECSPQPL